MEDQKAAQWVECLEVLKVVQMVELTVMLKADWKAQMMVDVMVAPWVRLSVGKKAVPMVVLTVER